MKVNGIKNDKEKALHYYPVDRGGEIMMFVAQPVWSMTEFHRLCPLPTPADSSVRFTTKGKEPNYECPQYRQDLAAYERKRWGWTILETLKPSNLDFEGKISLDDPETWVLVESELKDEFGHFEFANIMQLVDVANSLDGDKLEANLQKFFIDQNRKNGSSLKSTQQADPVGSTCSEPANVSA